MAELTISADEIRSAIQNYVSDYTPDVSREEVGVVTEAGDGIARVEGLPSVMTNELLEFESGVRGLALDHGRRLQLERAATGGLDVAAAVDRVPERVDDAAEVAVADGDAQHLAGAADLLALLDPGEVTQDDDADLAHVEVQRQTTHTALELEQLVGHDRRQTLDTGDAVAGLGDRADLLAGDVGAVLGDVVLDGTADLVCGDRQLGHGSRPLPCGGVWGGSVGGGGQPASRRSAASRRWAMLPSMTSSPTWTTRPPITVGSTVICRPTVRP